MRKLLGILLMGLGLIGLLPAIAPGLFHGIYGSLALREGPYVSREVRELLDQHVEQHGVQVNDETEITVPANKLSTLVEYGAVLQRIYNSHRGGDIITRGIVLCQSMILMVVGSAFLLFGVEIRKASNKSMVQSR